MFSLGTVDSGREKLMNHRTGVESTGKTSWPIFIAALALSTIVLSTIVRADVAREISKQVHSAKACNDDAACLRLWFDEYRTGLIEEFHFWRAFRQDAIAGDPKQAELDMISAFTEKRYRHIQWDAYARAGFSGVDHKTLTDVTEGCRTASMYMKYWLLAIRSGKLGADATDRHDFDDAAKQCVNAERNLSRQRSKG